MIVMGCSFLTCGLYAIRTRLERYKVGRAINLGEDHVEVTVKVCFFRLKLSGKKCRLLELYGNCMLLVILFTILFFVFSFL